MPDTRKHQNSHARRSVGYINSVSTWPYIGSPNVIYWSGCLSCKLSLSSKPWAHYPLQRSVYTAFLEHPKPSDENRKKRKKNKASVISAAEGGEEQIFWADTEFWDYVDYDLALIQKKVMDVEEDQRTAHMSRSAFALLLTTYSDCRTEFLPTS